MFLVPKLGVNQWRRIIDLRQLNRYSSDYNMTCETLEHTPHMSCPGNYFVSLDLADGYYTLSIRKAYRDFFTVNCRGEVWRLAYIYLPMRWSGSVYYFSSYPRSSPTIFAGQQLRNLPLRHHPSQPPSRRFLRNAWWRGARLLSYMDEFLSLADFYHATLIFRARVVALLTRLGLLRNVKTPAIGPPPKWATTLVSPSTSKGANFEPRTIN
jgi:hypothetical protein